MAGNFLTTDLASILNTNEFAVTATYGGVTIRGIFDDEDVEVPMGDGTTRIIPQCMFTGRSEDFSGIADGQTLTVSGTDYTIRTWMDDGTGVIEIFMGRP